ncbi:uncharacterized protein [Epargyreus clarus]|uniref:uncharacterized protein n=1 Tax=Epargyreus clarus TaxID=520877 RepID=UPI003C2D3154
MSSVSDLLANQQQLASAIESVYTNFKKDGASRKTAEYIKKRLDLLDRYWFEYEANYSRLSGMDLDANVRDFINKDLEGMNERYGNIKGHIRSSEVAAAERPQSPLLKPPTFALKPQGQADLPQITPQQGSSKAASQSSSSMTSLTEDMLRKQQSNFKAFHRTIEYIHVEDISERWELEDSLRTVQSRWSIIDTLHWELDSQLNGSNEDYERAFASYERKYQDIKRAITTFTDYVETVKKPRELPDLKEFLEFLEAKFTSLESLHKVCRECNKSHNRLLHDALAQSQNTYPTKEIDRSREGNDLRGCNAAEMNGSARNLEKQFQGGIHVSLQNDPSEVLLPMAMIKVQAADGEYHVMRALLDQGSQTSLISERAAQLLKIPRQRCKGVISGVGAKDSNCKGMISIQCFSLTCDYSFETDALIMKNLIKNLPTSTFSKPKWSYLDQIKLADPEFYISRPVEILLGADVYSNILMDGVCKGEATLPTAQQTQLGWILSGNVKTFQCNVVINNLEEIQRFWEIEDIADSSELSLEDEHCLNFYQDTTARRKDGRYEVRLPLKPGYEEKLGESKPKAIAQFYQLEKKINKQPEILESYKLFMHEYLKLGHMTTASGNSKPNCYLPHHCVRREDSTTTKFRVVFNASAITSSSMSLNDLMFRGPNLQHDLQDIIIAWRQYKYAYTADLEKMFRQIWLHPSDQNLQKIIWRDSPLDHLREYQLATVTYGTKAAPFLAMMTLRQLARDEKSNYPDSMAPEVLESSFYMDDLVHGSHTPEEAKQLQVDLINILNSGGFNIRKWKSNLPELVKGVNSDSLNPGYDFKQPESTKTLGLGWNPEEDQFTFQLQISLSSARPTKRSLLSDTSKVFDPLVLGWLNGNINRWKPFVANRVRQVTELMPPDCWQYVASKENPADCASRGLTACQLKEHKLWWEGPTWLTMYTPENKNQPLYVTNEDMKKVKQANVVLSNRDEIIEKLIDKQSSLSKAIRILAWVLRFKRKAQKHAYLTLQELTKSRNLIIKYFQDKHFIDEMDRLKECKTVSSSSKIYNLNPKIDEHGILRVGGRLKHANIDCDMKYPVIIPNNTRLSDLIIDETHKLTFHGGARLTTAFIRRKYWIIGGNNATKKRLRRCVQCKKQSPILERQLMGDLPSARINPSRPFSHCGIDYTGHVSVKANKGRGIRTNKGYVAVFVCMATKAVHLELVSDLTASAFLAALHRMVARRGVPDHIYSDQGKNFIGADNALRQQLEYIKNTYNEELMTELTSMGIEWHFNSPSWPSAGGLWEAAVKSLKHHLKRVLGDQKLTFEEFTTLLTRIEGCLNSRPLCPLT